MALPQTDQLPATREQIRSALGILNDLSPTAAEGYFNKYGNPFIQWPPLQQDVETFLRFFETTTPMPEQGTETITPPVGSYVETTTPLPNSLDAKKLDDLVNVFNQEIEAAKQGRLHASDAAKKFVIALKENAKISNVTIPETQAPVPMESEGAPVSPERIQNVISAVVQYPGPPEEKILVFHALASFASEQPNREIKELLPRATEVAEVARVLSSPEETLPKIQSFSALATNNFQKSVARALDVIVAPAAKEAIINKILLQPLDNFVNHPEKIPSDLMETMTDRWGTNFVNSSWFTALRTDANRMIGDQKNALKVTTRFNVFVSDVVTTVFRSPVTARDVVATNVITYIETYRLVATQGVPMVSVSHYNNVVLGYGGQLVRMGANYVIKRGVKAAAEKAAVSAATKVGAEAIAGAASGGTLTLAMFGANVLNWLKNKGAALLKSLLFVGNSKNPEDNLLLVVGAGVALVFFLPLFPLFNIPAFNQSMIDTSLATNAGTGSNGIVGPPIGPPTLSCANTNGVYLSQSDPRWGTITYGCHPCTIASSACGPTSDTMILNAFGSPATVPQTVNSVVAANGYCGYCASTVQANVNLLTGAGLSVSSLGTSCPEASQVLKNCGLIFAWGTSHRPLGGVEHFLVITGMSCDAAGNAVSYSTLDPAYALTTQDPSTFTIHALYGVVK